MKKLFFVLPLALLMFVACKTSVKGKNGVEYKSAIQYNDYIVNKQTDIAKEIMQFASESQTDLTKAESTIDNAIVKVDKSITDLEGMPDWKGNTTLRDNAVSLFKFYKKIFSSDYKRMIAIQKDGSVSPEEETEYNKMMATLTSTEGKLDASFKSAQTEFASKNGFKVGVNEMQGKIDEMKKE